jgi:hypothetical protein
VRDLGPCDTLILLRTWLASAELWEEKGSKRYNVPSCGGQPRFRARLLSAETKRGSRTTLAAEIRAGERDRTRTNARPHSARPRYRGPGSSLRTASRAHSVGQRTERSQERRASPHTPLWITRGVRSCGAARAPRGRGPGSRPRGRAAGAGAPVRGHGRGRRARTGRAWRLSGPRSGPSTETAPIRARACRDGRRSGRQRS